MVTQNTHYTFEGTFKNILALNLIDTFKGDICADPHGFFKKGLLTYVDDSCMILGHIKNKNYITTLSFIVSLENDQPRVDCIYTFSNMTSKYDPLSRNFEGYYVGKWFLNLQTPVPMLNRTLLQDYSEFEKIINSASQIGGYAELDLVKKEYSCPNELLLRRA